MIIMSFKENVDGVLKNEGRANGPKKETSKPPFNKPLFLAFPKRVAEYITLFSTSTTHKITTTSISGSCALHQAFR
jgi:hypothetical protein